MQPLAIPLTVYSSEMPHCKSRSSYKEDYTAERHHGTVLQLKHSSFICFLFHVESDLTIEELLFKRYRVERDNPLEWVLLMAGFS